MCHMWEEGMTTKPQIYYNNNHTLHNNFTKKCLRIPLKEASATGLSYLSDCNLKCSLM